MNYYSLNDISKSNASLCPSLYSFNLNEANSKAFYIILPYVLNYSLNSFLYSVVGSLVIGSYYYFYNILSDYI